jgi:hypothetical protein
MNSVVTLMVAHYAAGILMKLDHELCHHYTAGILMKPDHELCHTTLMASHYTAGILMKRTGR